MTTTASLSFAALTIDCADPAALADFWGRPWAARSARARSRGTRRSTPPAPTAAPG